MLVKKNALARVCVLGFILFIISCNTEKKQKDFIVGFSQCTGGDNWRKVMLTEMERELSFHENVTFIYKDAKANSNKQVKQIEELLDENIDVLIVSPNEFKPLSRVIEKVYDAGIPVVIVDRQTDTKKYTAFVGASNFEVGQNAGRYTVALLKGKGNVIELGGLPQSSPVIDRHNGFMDIISGYKGIRYIKMIDDDSHPFAKAVKEAITANPDLDLIYAQNDFMAIDAYNICKDLGVEKKIKIIGIDGLAIEGGGLDMVESKKISATVLYPTGGQEAMITAINILENKPFKKENQLFTTIIDSTNVRIMKMQNAKVLEQQKNIDRSQNRIEQQQIITQNQVNVIYAVSISLALSLILGFILFYYLKENRKINSRLALRNEEISNQRNQLIELSKQAKEATDAKINFFTNISHEFRTPLTLILGPIEELIANSKINYNDKQYLTLIQKNVLRLLRLVNQLIDFRKIESDKLTVAASENDLIKFTNEIIAAFKETAKKRNIDLRIISKERTLPLWFDVSMLDKVLFNLLSNAFKFTGDNGFIHITIEKDTEQSQAVIKVEDNGIGMSKEVAEHAFELFYQANITSQQGSGLGLSLSKELINLHKGSITVNSKQGKGTCFEIRLLMGKEHLNTAEELTENAMENIIYSDQKIYSTDIANMLAVPKNGHLSNEVPEQTILIIEDNPDLNLFLKEILQNEFSIITAADGVAGLKLAYDNVPDIIISDVVLPGKDGFFITNTLKSDIKTSHIPIILLTAKTDVQQQIEGMKNMADAYVTKPFNVQFLKETIRSVMKNREILREHYTSEINTETKSQTPRKLDRKFINEFTAIVESNISNDQFSVEDICKSLCISRVQLYRKVKALLDCNVNDYILSVRLQKAKHYLNQGELSVSEIAYKVGFASPAYFSTVFKSKFGASPKEFKSA